MQEKTFELINKLISLSGTKNTNEDIDLKLKEIETKKTNYLLELEMLNKKKETNNYFNEAEKLLDENTRMNLLSIIKTDEEKLESVNKKLVKYSSLLEESEKTKNKINNEYITIKDTISNLSLLDKKTLNEKILKYLKKLELNHDEYLNELKEYDDQIGDLSEKIWNSQVEKDILIEKIFINKNKVTKITDKLEEEINYINNVEKEKDSKKIELITENIEKLDNEKLEIQTTPFYLATDLMRLIKQNKFSESGYKLKELVSVMETIPHINVKKEEELYKELNRLNAKYIFYKKRVSKNSYNKDYYEELEREKETFIKLKKDVQEKINNYKKEIKKELNNEIPSIITLKIETNYKNNIVNNVSDYINILKKVVIPELEKLYFYYKDIIESLEIQINEKENEFSDIKRKEDLEEIKKLDVEIRLVERRLELKRTLHDVYKEIDLLISSLEFDM